MDIVSIVFAQLFFVLILGAIGGIVWYAYQTNKQQKTSRSARSSDRNQRERKPKSSRQAPVPEPEPEQKDEEESEAEPEPEPEPEPAAKKGKKNKKKAATEEKKPQVQEKKPQAKAAPVQAAPAKKAAAKAAAPAQKAPAAAKKPVVEEKKEEPKSKKAAQKKKLQEQQAQFEASLAASNLAALKKGNAQKAQDTEAGWTKTVSKQSKRSANKEETKSTATSASVQIKARQIPLIIGTEGHTLRAIVKHSGAEVNIEKSNRKDPLPDVPITVSIKGSPANCAVAEALIKELLAEGYTSVTHPGFVSASYKLKSPDRDRSLIVGPKGEYIKKLQKNCGVRIHLPPNRESQEINIIGPEPNCKKAVEAIDTLLREGYSTMTHEGFVRGEVEGVSPSQYPTIIGKKGENIARIQKETSTKITVPNKDNGLTYVTIFGQEAKVNKAREMILDLLAKDSASPVVESDDPSNPWSAVNVNTNEDW